MANLDFNTVIENIIKAKQKPLTKEEAKHILRLCGILNKNNKIADAYKDIFEEKKDFSCPRYEERERLCFTQSLYTTYKQGYCLGTKEIEQCNCCGDTRKCDFYPEKRGY